MLTSKDDNSVGGLITGSSGNPANTGATCLTDGGTQTSDYSYLRLAYAGTGISMANTDAVWHSQFVQCKTGVSCSTNIALHNVLMAQERQLRFNGFCGVGRAIDARSIHELLPGSRLHGGESHQQHPDRGDESAGAHDGLLRQQQHRRWGLPECGWRQLLPGQWKHQSGGGNHELINATLLSAIKAKTTWPPLLLSGFFFTNSVTLFPQAPLDSGSPPDLGYHYDPLDYVWSNQTVNIGATLTLSNGVSVGIFGTNGLLLPSAALVSQGTPLFMNHIGPCVGVQEQPLTGLNTLISQNIAHSLGSMYFRFTGPADVGAVRRRMLQVADSSAGSQADLRSIDVSRLPTAGRPAFDHAEPIRNHFRHDRDDGQ